MGDVINFPLVQEVSIDGPGCVGDYFVHPPTVTDGFASEGALRSAQPARTQMEPPFGMIHDARGFEFFY